MQLVTLLDGMRGHPLGSTWRYADSAAQSRGLCVNMLDLVVCRRRTCHADSPMPTPGSIKGMCASRLFDDKIPQDSSAEPAFPLTSI